MAVITALTVADAKLMIFMKLSFVHVPLMSSIRVLEFLLNQPQVIACLFQLLFDK
jgi:hypothetical protein